MKNIKRTVIALTIISSMITPVYAQWSTADENLPSEMNSLRQAIGKMQDSIVNSIKGMTGNQQIEAQQANRLQEDTDKRNRLSRGMDIMVQRDIDQQPNLGQCAEMTAGQAGSGAYRATLSSPNHVAGGGRNRFGPGAREANIKNTATALVAVVENKKSLGTCNTSDEGVAGCGSPGQYAGSDTHPLGLTANTKDVAQKTDPKTGKVRNLINYSLEKNGQEVALTNANNAVYYDAPRALDKTQREKNPAYVAMSDTIMQKLRASGHSLLAIASLRYENQDLSTNPYWANSKNDYTEIISDTFPTNPSFFELLNFAVLRDFIGTNSSRVLEAGMDEKAVQKEISRKLSLSNMVALKQFEATERNNILLSHMLVQMTTPTNIQAVHAEHAKTLNLK